jgi:K+-sensing histidine kinase KdpD
MLVPDLLNNNDMVLKKRDKVRFSEGMWNLLNNGTRFTEKGRTISAGKKKDEKIHFTITVKDSGGGIDMEHLSNQLQNLRCTTSNVEGSLKVWRTGEDILKQIPSKAG